MNWEKLFAKMMSNKGHGRRWKFLIETIKQKAKLGYVHKLQQLWGVEICHIYGKPFYYLFYKSNI